MIGMLIASRGLGLLRGRRLGREAEFRIFQDAYHVSRFPNLYFISCNAVRSDQLILPSKEVRHDVETSVFSRSSVEHILFSTIVEPHNLDCVYASTLSSVALAWTQRVRVSVWS